MLSISTVVVDPVGRRSASSILASQTRLHSLPLFDSYIWNKIRAVQRTRPTTNLKERYHNWFILSYRFKDSKVKERDLTLEVSLTCSLPLNQFLQMSSLICSQFDLNGSTTKSKDNPNWRKITTSPNAVLLKGQFQISGCIILNQIWLS